MAKNRLRVPVNFLVVPAIFCGVFTIISGGVAVTQGPNAVWWPCLAFLGGLVLLGAVYALLPVDWISDRELQDIERADRSAEADREVEALVKAAKDGTLERKMLFLRLKDYGLIALVLILIVFRFLLNSRRGFLGFNAPLPNGGSGAAIGGMTFGSIHLLGRDWTGVELALIVPLLAFLIHILRKGFGLVARAQKKSD